MEDEPMEELSLYTQPARLPKILGVDFQLDWKANPWMLEVNRFPSLGYRSKLEHEVKRDLLLSTWKLMAGEGSRLFDLIL